MMGVDACGGGVALWDESALFGVSIFTKKGL